MPLAFTALRVHGQLADEAREGWHGLPGVAGSGGRMMRGSSVEGHGDVDEGDPRKAFPGLWLPLGKAGTEQAPGSGLWAPPSGQWDHSLV